MSNPTRRNTRAILQCRVSHRTQPHGENAGVTYDSVGKTCDGTVYMTIAQCAITRYIKDAGCARHRSRSGGDDGAEV